MKKEIEIKEKRVLLPLEAYIDPISEREKLENKKYFIKCLINDYKENIGGKEKLILIPVYKYWFLAKEGLIENDGIFIGSKEIHYNSKWTNLPHESLIRKFFKDCEAMDRNLEEEFYVLYQDADYKISQL